MSEFAGKSERVREMCRRLAPVLGSNTTDLFQAYVAEDETGKEQLERYLEIAMGKHFPNGVANANDCLVPPSPTASDGAYRLGSVAYGGKEVGPFGLRESEWIQHVGVFGRSGAGKTNMGYNILRQIKRQGKPFLVFDWKRNYRDLTSLPEFEDTLVYTPGRGVASLSFNPLIPPEGTAPKTWLKKIIEVIAHAYMLGDGVLYLLQQSVDAVYERFGVYSGKVERYPTLRDVLEEAKNRNAKGREAGWMSSTLRALASLCFGDMDTVINEGANQGLQHLLSRPVILELDALTQSDKVFFIQSLLLWIHHFRMTEGKRETFKHAILIEEAHHVLSGERRSLVGGQSVMEITFREVREFGESIIILDQHPSQIAISALGNTYTTICLNVKHSRDVSAMGQCMLMDSSERDVLGQLEVGTAVVKLQGRAPRPFLITIPEFPLQKGTVSDAEVTRRMSALVTPDATPAMPSLHETNVPSSAETPEPSEEHLREIHFLGDVMKHAESGVAERYKRLNLSVRQGQKIKARLVSDCLIEEHRKRTRTGVVRVIRLTEKGAARLNST